jgi:hypothetical protein
MVIRLPGIAAACYMPRWRDDDVAAGALDIDAGGEFADAIANPRLVAKEDVRPTAPGPRPDGLGQGPVALLQGCEILVAAMPGIDVDGKESGRRTGCDADIGMGAASVAALDQNEIGGRAREAGFARGGMLARARAARPAAGAAPLGVDPLEQDDGPVELLGIGDGGPGGPRKGAVPPDVVGDRREIAGMLFRRLRCTELGPQGAPDGLRAGCP